MIFKDGIKDGKGRVVYVQSPTKRIVRIENKNYFLSLPYVAFKVNYTINARGKFKIPNDDELDGDKIRSAHSPVYCAFSSSAKLTNLYIPPFPNIWSDGSVCFSPGKGLTFDTIEDLCKHIIGKFWSSTFDLSATDNLHSIRINRRSMPVFKNFVEVIRVSDEWRRADRQFQRKDNVESTLWQEKTKSNLSWRPGSKDMLPMLKKYSKEFLV